MSPYHLPRFSRARSPSSLNPEGRHIHGKQQYTLVLGEDLKTTVTEPLEMLLLFGWGFLVGWFWVFVFFFCGCEPLGIMRIQCLQIKHVMFAVGYLKAESLNEKILEKILALSCTCFSYFIAPNTMCVLYMGLRLTVICFEILWWEVLPKYK